jgi:cysteine desulfurase
VNAPIYLDYAATTPVAPEVARAMSEVLGAEADFGNPSSVTHAFGRRAQARVATARAQVAALIGASPEDIVFTSGATESNNLALLGVARASSGKTRHIVTSKIEHKAVLDPCRQLEREGFAVTYVAPDSSGRVPPESIRAALRADTVLVSVMHANNEIGVIQDIAAIGALCRERGIAFHVDAAQSVGKIPIDLRERPVDLLSFTAHKIYGPKGIGALYVRPEMRARLKPVTFGGGQERGMRPGTLPTHQIVGLGAACELAARSLASEPARLERLRERLWQGLRRLEGVHLNGEAAPRLPGILNVSFEGVEGESLVTALDSLAVATGSACSSASGDPSYVLRALGRGTQLAQSSLRFSLGRATSEADIDAAITAVLREVTRLRAASPAGSGQLDGRADITAGGFDSAARGAQDADSIDTNGGCGAGGALDSPAAAAGVAAGSAVTAGTAAAGARAGSEPSTSASSLSALAERYFRSLPGVGAMTPAPGVVQGTAGSPTHEAWVRFHLRTDGSIVKAALFQAWGCPHTLAVTAWVTGQLPGRSMTDLVPGTPSAWLQALEVPVEKLGRLLMVEDALRAVFQQWKEAP